MLEMIGLLASAIILVSISLSLKKHRWVYIVDNLTIAECRKFDDLSTAKQMYDLCIADGHETYLKRVRAQSRGGSREISDVFRPKNGLTSLLYVI